jgi:hypothetical protein
MLKELEKELIQLNLYPCQKCHKLFGREEMYAVHWRRNIFGWKSKKHELMCVRCAEKNKRLRSRIMAERI